MDRSIALTTVLLADARAQIYAEKFRETIPDIRFVVVTSHLELIAALTNHKPTVAYSCVSSAFARQHHRQIMDIPDLQWLHVGGSGIDHFEGWQLGKFKLTNGKGVLACYLADTIITMIRAFSFRLTERLAAQRARQWLPLAFADLADKRLLIVGTGAIARHVAGKAAGLGMRVEGISQRSREIAGFGQVYPRSRLKDRIQVADFVSLHLQLDHETAHLINADILDAMKPDAYLLNAARGGVVDETALIAALAEKRIAGAYLDVFETEPLPAENRLWDFDNVIISAHTADAVDGWEAMHASLFLENLERWRLGRQLRNEIKS